MGYTAQEVADLRAKGFTTAAIQTAERNLQKAADEALGRATLASAGLTQEVIATLVDNATFALSESVDDDGYPKSDWCGQTISLNYPDMGIHLKVVLTVANPDAFPEHRDAIVARKKIVAARRNQKGKKAKLGTAQKLGAQAV